MHDEFQKALPSAIRGSYHRVVEFRQLRYFVAVAEELNFGRAARRLQMSQPPLSMQIKALERELGVLLLERDSHGVRMTPAGAAMLESAYEVLGLLDLLPARVVAAATEESRTFAVGAVPLAVPNLLPAVLRRLSTSFPSARLVVREMISSDQIEALEAGALDIGLIRRGFRSAKLSQETALAERLIAAVPSDHDLADSAEIKLADLKDEDFVFYAREVGHWQFDELIRICETVGGFTPRVAHQSHTVMHQMGLISSGLGVALVTELTKSIHFDDITYLPLTDVTLGFPLIAAWNSDSHDVVREEFLRILGDEVASRFPLAGGN